ncbi:MAG: helix-turn-helix domain-containing protein [Bacillus sp. (in: firmicutes)]
MKNKSKVLTQLRLRRQYKSMTIRDLENVSGIDKAMISRIENGMSDPQLSTVERLATALGAQVIIK